MERSEFQDEIRFCRPASWGFVIVASVWGVTAAGKIWGLRYFSFASSIIL
jgi:hypothetical protein